MSEISEFKTVERDDEISAEDATKVFQLIGSIFYHGNFIAETPNERDLQEVLDKNGYFFRSEDDLIKKIYG